MRFEGIYTPAITPFDRDGEPDRAAFAAVLESLIEAGVHGIVVGGSTGEYYAQSAQKRFDLAAWARQVIGSRLPLVVGTGATRTEDSVEYARAAKEIGADGILVSSPPYAMPTERENAVHALTIDRAANLPIMLYNYPGRMGVTMGEEYLMFEPRGHDIMSGAIIYPAWRDDCDFAVIFIEVSGCLPMCGAGTIGLVTAAIEEGLVTPRLPGKLAIETPAGKVDIAYEKPGEFVDSVRMFNVDSYLHAADLSVDVPGLGPLVVDIAYGGNYYAVIEPQPSWPGLDGMSASDIVALSRSLRHALGPVCDPVHPEDDRIRGVHHAIWCDRPARSDADGRGAVFYGDKAIDRSPGGTGTSARIAQLHGKGRLRVGDSFGQESLIGTVFEGRVEAETGIGPFPGIRPSVAGWARIIGHNTIFVDDRDPLAHGFQIV